AEWQAVFEAYKQTPEYRLKNVGMDLAGFQAIFFWEYAHRVLGRLIGLVYALPFAWFLFRGAFARPLAWKLGAGLALGGMQGLMGWLMVKSGLVDQPRVSHFRLAAHLGLAFLIIAWLGWILFSLRPAPLARRKEGLPRRLLALVAGLTVLQILYGAFVAGLRAGWGYNSFPKMGDRWIADAVMALDPWWSNLLYDHASVQFLHRVLGTLLLLAVGWLWFRHRHEARDAAQRLALDALAVLVLFQYALGVYTLVKVVPLVPAVMHQGCAALVVFALVAVFRASGAPAVRQASVASPQGLAASVPE
ncbi:MAG: COX15/CtaA family protein, partial [Gammaproteobacteria bacterium]